MIRTPMQNDLLAALPAGIYGRLASHLELVALVRGSAIYEPGAELEYAVFPHLQHRVDTESDGGRGVA